MTTRAVPPSEEAQTAPRSVPSPNIGRKEANAGCASPGDLAQEWTPPLRSPQRRPPPDAAGASVGAPVLDLWRSSVGVAVDDSTGLVYASDMNSGLWILRRTD